MKKKEKIKFLNKAESKKAIIKLIYVLICICMLYNVMFLINTTITKKDYFSVFGISLFSMKDEMMKPEINKNDLVITKSEDLEINDNISYYINGNVRINKIINETNEDGKKVYITKSNNSYYPELEKVDEKQIIGKVINTVPIVGYITTIIQSKITTLIIIILLFLKFSYNKYMYKESRKRKVKKIKS